MTSDPQLIAALRAADEQQLISLANKGVYKRAVKDAETIGLDTTEAAGKTVVFVGGEQCVLGVPLSESACTCPSRTVCRHIITAILLMKKALPDEPAPAEQPAPPEPEKPAEPEVSVKEKKEPPQKLTAAELEKIRGSAEMCTGLICGVLSHGLVRVPDTAAEDFELAAVRCHAAKMAECERLMRGLGGRLADCAARRASFDSRVFTSRLLETADHLALITGGEITEDKLGSFRGVYESVKGSLDIIPVGQRRLSGGEHEGDIFYFVNADESAESRFLTFSDLRPTFYETGSRKRPPEVSPWGLGASLRSMMKQRMTLVNAKVCEGRLSSSKETVVSAQSPAVLDSSVIHRLMVTDFREIIVKLGRRDTDRETDRLFFIYPKRMTGCGFDKHTQKLVMTFEDERGCKVDCVVKYRAESKSFIEQLERICQRISMSAGRIFTLLVSAYIEEGKLWFFPIEVYDFIMPIELHTFGLPQEFEQLTEDGGCAEEIGRHLSRVRDMLTDIVRTGLQSEHDCTKLISESRSLGMEGLAGLISETAAAADSCRHSVNDNTRAVLASMRKLNLYINAAEKRVEIVSALRRLEESNKGEDKNVVRR